jgi:hypothetical protein
MTLQQASSRPLAIDEYLAGEQDGEVRRAAAGWNHTRHEQGRLRIDCLQIEVPLADLYQDLPI